MNNLNNINRTLENINTFTNTPYEMSVNEQTEIKKSLVNSLESISKHYQACNSKHNFFVYSYLSKQITQFNNDELIGIYLKLNQVRSLILKGFELKTDVKSFLDNDSTVELDNSEVANFDKQYKQLEATVIKINRHLTAKISSGKDIEDRENIEELINTLYVSELGDLKKQLNSVRKKISVIQREIRVEPFNRFPSLKEKKGVIFSCSYGTGHKVTATAIQKILEQAGSQTATYDLSTGALKLRDVGRKFAKFFGIKYNDDFLTSVDVFNEILRRQWYVVVNIWQKVDLFFRKILGIGGKNGVEPPAPSADSWSKRQIRKLLMTEKPDYIVTTYHMDLNPIIEVAREMNIPILHVPTDYDVKAWEVFGKKRPTYPLFKCLLPNKDVQDTVKSAAPISAEQLVSDVGIPLRPEFYKIMTSNEQSAYRERRGIAQDEKVLYLSTGGNGQNLPHAELLANSSTWNTPLRIIIAAGRNREYVRYLQETLTPRSPDNPFILQGSNPNVTVEIAVNPDVEKRGTEEEFFLPASEISQILDIADGSLAKAGGLSVSELLFKGVPVLFDQRITSFAWELFNVKVAKEQNIGLSSFKIENLERDLKQLFTLRKERKAAFHFSRGREVFCQTIANLIARNENPSN